MEKGLVISSQQQKKYSTLLDQICFQGTFVIWSKYFGTNSAKPQSTCSSTPTTMLTSNFNKTYLYKQRTTAMTSYNGQLKYTPQTPSILQDVRLI
jgi:hypothetical protein